MSDVLREFFYSLGFKVDSASQNKALSSVKDYERAVVEAERAVEAARLAGAKSEQDRNRIQAEINLKNARNVLQQAKDKEIAEANAAKAAKERGAALVKGLVAVATAATAAATATTVALTRISKGMEEVYWASKRTNASAGNLKAFQFAAEKLGASAGQAGSSIEALAERMRASPGYEKLLNDLGVATKQNGKVRDLTESMVDLGDAFAKMPMFQAKAYAEALGIDEKTLMALRSGEFKKYVNEYREMLAKARLDPDKAAADSKAFMDVWRRMTSAVEIVAIKVQSAIVERFGGSLTKFSDWLLENADRVSGAVLGIADTMLRLADRATDLFRAFDKLSPGTKDTVVQLLALGAALLVLKSGPLGVILALSAAILALYDDFRKWQEGSRDTLLDWGKWGPGLEKCLAFLTSETGLTAAFVALGAVLALKVLAPLGKVMGLLGSLGALKPPAWLLGLLGLTGLAAAANSQGILNAGEGSRSPGEAVLRTLDPGLADRVYGPTPRDQAADGKDGRNLWQKYAPKWAGGKDAPGKGVPDGGPRLGSQGPVSGSQAEREQRVMARLIARGWTPEAAASAVGQAVEESGVRSNGPRGDNGTAHGMFQWRKERFEALKRFAKERGKDWTDFDSQVDFFDQERKQRGARERNWHNETDLGRGNRAGYDFERYAGPLQEQRRRHAERVLRQYRNGQAAPPPPVLKVDPAIIPKVEKGLQDFNNRFGDSWGAGNSAGEKIAPARPLGGNISNSSSTVKKTEINVAPTTVTVSGVGDAREASDVISRHQSRVYADLLRNLQGATA